jgi:hypothetical protein
VQAYPAKKDLKKGQKMKQFLLTEFGHTTALNLMQHLSKVRSTLLSIIEKPTGFEELGSLSVQFDPKTLEAIGVHFLSRNPEIAAKWLASLPITTPEFNFSLRTIDGAAYIFGAANTATKEGAAVAKGLSLLRPATTSHAISLMLEIDEEDIVSIDVHGETFKITVPDSVEVPSCPTMALYLTEYTKVFGKASESSKLH